MASSKAEIANIALSTYLGKGRINALDERSPAALQVNMHYDSVRREVLAEWPWSFATKRAKLTRLSNNDQTEWGYKYAIPTGMMGLRWVNDPQVAKEALVIRRVWDTPRLVQDGFIYSDTQDATAEYTFDNDDPTTYSPKFEAAMAGLLAYRTAVALTETAAKAQAGMDAYLAYLDEAKVQDARLEPPIEIVAYDDWVR